MKYIAYFLYVIVWEVFLWAGTVYLIVIYDWSKWWFLLTLALSFSTYRLQEVRSPERPKDAVT